MRVSQLSERGAQGHISDSEEKVDSHDHVVVVLARAPVLKDFNSSGLRSSQGHKVRVFHIPASSLSNRCSSYISPSIINLTLAYLLPFGQD